MRAKYLVSGGNLCPASLLTGGIRAQRPLGSPVGGAAFERCLQAPVAKDPQRARRAFGPDLVTRKRLCGNDHYAVLRRGDCAEVDLHLGIVQGKPSRTAIGG